MAAKKQTPPPADKAETKEPAVASGNDSGEEFSVTPAVTATNGVGSIQISEDVIAAIVRRYALRVPGVARLAGQGVVGSIGSIFGKRINDKSIVVLGEDDRVNITITLIVKFGEHVPTVALNVQNVCRKYIEDLAGQHVGDVNVVVAGLEMPEDEEAE